MLLLDKLLIFGRIRDNKNDKELYVRFSMKQNAAPVAQRPRSVLSAKDR